MNRGSVKTTRIVSTVFLCLAFLSASAQDTFLDRYIVRNVAMEEGLPCNYVDDVCTDSFSFLWIATSGGGLCRYDGYELLTLNTGTVPALKTNFIRNIEEDNFGRLWIGSEKGLEVLDLRTLEKLELPLPLPEDPENPLCSYITKDATGAVWTKFGTTLYRFSFGADGSLSGTACFRDGRLSPDNFVFKDVEADGSVWCSLGGRLHKIAMTAQGELEAQAVRTTLDFGENTYISDYLPQGQQVWISTENGLYLLHRQTGEWKRYASDPRDPKSLTQNFVTGLTLTEDGLLLASTLRGYNVYNPVTDNFERVGVDVVNCIKRTGRYILEGTEVQGLRLLSPKHLDIRHYTNVPGDPGSLPPGAVNAMYQEEGGRLWVGTVEGGLSIRESGSARFLHLTRERGGLGHNSVSALAEGEAGILYVGTWGSGIDEVSMQPPYKLLRHLPPLDIRTQYIGALEYDSRNRLLWVCSNQGIFLYNPADRTYLPALEESVSGCIGSCIDSKGFLWVGCQQGLIVFDLRTRSADGTFPFTRYRYKLDAPGTRAGEMICAIREVSEGVLYLAGNGSGVYKAELQEDGSYRFTCYNSAQGLSNDQVRGICADRQGRVWISTQHGLDLLDPETGIIIPFLKEDGVAYTQFYWNNACQGTDGLLYFGHMEGFSVVDPSRYSAEPVGGPLRFTRIEVGDRRSLDPEQKLLRVHQRDRTIRFRFAALLPESSAGGVRYQYRLEGYDPEWQTLPEGSHEALYSALPSGTYPFHVRAVLRAGAVVGTLDSEVQVQPYFYYTWWFYLLLFLVLIALVWGIIRWRTASSRQRQAELEQMVEDRTQEISAQKRLVEQKADELRRQNEVLRHQNEELVSRKLLSVSREKEPFKEKALETLKGLYKDPDLDVTAFCQAMGMSKTLLNMRLQEAFGQSVSQLIRTYRLTLAREMLESGSKLTVAEIAYETGFNDPKYFTRCFTKEFGVVPSAVGKR